MPTAIPAATEKAGGGQRTVLAETPPPGAPRGSQRRWIVVIVGVLTVALAVAGFAWWRSASSTPTAGPLRLSGRLEGYTSQVGAKVGGRVTFVSVREGDRVRRGEVLVRLDDAEARAQFDGADARVVAAQRAVTAVRAQIPLLQTQIDGTDLARLQSGLDSQGRIDQAESNVAAAVAQVTQGRSQVIASRSDLRLARIDRGRYAALSNTGDVSRQTFDQAQARYDDALAGLRARESAVEASRAQEAAARAALAVARTTGLTPQIRATEINGLHARMRQAAAQTKSAEADVDAAKAARRQAHEAIVNLTVVSPIDGIVSTRLIEPGEVIAAGKPLLALVDLRTIYLRGFVPEGDIGAVRVGQKARVFLDSAPDRPFAAHVSAIDAVASFTPENVYFRKDRVAQVFGMKLSLDAPGGFAKPGMPADAEIDVERASR